MTNIEPQSVDVHGRSFRLYYSRAQIAEQVTRVAHELQEELKDVESPLFLCMLNGAFVFAADLLRAYGRPCEVQFVRFSSYQGMCSCGEVSQLLGLSIPIEGRNVIIVEDIVDSGLTMQHMLKYLESEGVASTRIATMFYKPEAFKGDYKIDFVGQKIDNAFVVGYGLDYNGLARELPDLYILAE